MGRDPRYVCTRPATKPETVTTTVTRIANISNDASSDEEEEDDDDTSSTPVQAPISKPTNERNDPSSSKTAVPLVDYILNVVSLSLHFQLFIIIYKNKSNINSIFY